MLSPRPATSFLSQSSCSLPEHAQAAGLEVHHVDQADEMDAVVVEALPACPVRPLAVAIQVALAVVGEDVVLAGDVEDLAGLDAS